MLTTKQKSMINKPKTINKESKHPTTVNDLTIKEDYKRRKKKVAITKLEKQLQHGCTATLTISNYHKYKCIQLSN
jgi:hypothetical protein